MAVTAAEIQLSWLVERMQTQAQHAESQAAHYRVLASAHEPLSVANLTFSVEAGCRESEAISLRQMLAVIAP